MHLQRARSRVHIITASNSPDDVSAFPQAVAAGYASEVRFFRQVSTSERSGGLSPRSPSLRRQSTGGSGSFSVARQRCMSFSSRLSTSGLLDLDEDRFLIAKAALAWRTEEDDYRDDITAIVLYLQELPADLVAEVQASASA